MRGKDHRAEKWEPVFGQRDAGIDAIAGGAIDRLHHYIASHMMTLDEGAAAPPIGRRGERAMLRIHHLGHSQSERIIWLCEELAIPYDLKRHQRDPITALSPPDLKALHPLGAAPVIEDGELVLAESAAIVDYISIKYGQNRLRLGPEHADFASYLYWFHFANGNLQPAMGRSMIMARSGLPPEHPVRASTQGRLERVLALIDARLGAATYLAGEEFTAADIMSVYSLTTMRLFLPLDLQPYPGILAYLQRIGARPAYRRAMAKGDPDLTPMLT